jgi:hypothetical protein
VPPANARTLHTGGLKHGCEAAKPSSQAPGE